MPVTKRDESLASQIAAAGQFIRLSEPPQGRVIYDLLTAFRQDRGMVRSGKCIFFDQ